MYLNLYMGESAAADELKDENKILIARCCKLPYLRYK